MNGALKWLFALSGLLLFVWLNWNELIPVMHDWPPQHLRSIHNLFGWNGLILLQLVAVLWLLLLLKYRREASREHWLANGMFVAFFIALMTEMYGLPLVILLLMPLLDVPEIGWPYVQRVGHGLVSFGMLLCFVGIALVVSGWRQVYRESGLCTTGAYKWIRHPQYAGIILLTCGWIIHYPTIAALVCWPILTLTYVRLALAEEKAMQMQHGDAYVEYARRTKRFIPGVI